MYDLVTIQNHIIRGPIIANYSLGQQPDTVYNHVCCRKQLAKIPVESNLDESCDDDVDSSYTCQQDQLESINECLKAIGETPVVKKEAGAHKLPKRKAM